MICLLVNYKAHMTCLAVMTTFPNERCTAHCTTERPNDLQCPEALKLPLYVRTEILASVNSSGQHESALQTAFRSVQPFLQGSPVQPTHTHRPRQSVRVLVTGSI